MWGACLLKRMPVETQHCFLHHWFDYVLSYSCVHQFVVILSVVAFQTRNLYENGGWAHLSYLVHIIIPHKIAKGSVSSWHELMENLHVRWKTIHLYSLRTLSLEMENFQNTVAFYISIISSVVWLLDQVHSFQCIMG